MQIIHAITHDPTARAPGQHTRAIVKRLRLRTLVALGVLAVATALLGRTFGLRDVRFLGSEVGLLVAMFVVLRYVMPLVDRHDRGAKGEEQVGSLLDGLEGKGWHAIHDASLGNGNVDHILIGPAGVFTVETKSNPGPVRVARIHGATLRPGPGPAKGDRARDGCRGGAADRLQPRMGGPPAGPAQGREGAPGEDARGLSGPAQGDALARAGAKRTEERRDGATRAPRPKQTPRPPPGLNTGPAEAPPVGGLTSVRA